MSTIKDPAYPPSEHSGSNEIKFKEESSFKKYIKIVIIALLALLLLAAIIAVIVLAVKLNQEYSKEEGKNQCTKKACINTAGAILNSVDLKVDPCKDFYQYACGEWLRTSVIPSGHVSYSQFHVVREENYKVLRKLIDLPLNESKNQAERKARILYQSCMDKDGNIEKLGHTPLYPMFQLLKGWSISTVGGVNYTDGDPWDLQDLFQRMYSLTNNFFFNVYVTSNALQPEYNILLLTQITVRDRSFILNKTKEIMKKITVYKDFLVDLGLVLGGSQNYTAEMADDVFELETTLLSFTNPPAMARQEYLKNNVRNISYLQTKYPQFDWLRLVNSYMKDANMTVNASEPILLHNVVYFDKLMPYLEELIKTPKGKRTIQNYFSWHILKLLARYLSSDFRQALYKYQTRYYGVQGSVEKWETCLGRSTSYMPHAVGAMFVRQKFREGSKESAIEMIKEIKKAFIDSLPKLSWMDEATRKAAISKANVMGYLIGYPDFILNNKLLDEYYKAYDVRVDEMLANLFRIGKADRIKALKMLRKKNNRNTWSMGAATVNAYYSPTRNHMVFPAGILQGRFFHKDLPFSMNYGAIGMVVGHELTHGFDDLGSNFDEKGMLEEWWSEIVRTDFKKKTQCLVDQYERYMVDGRPVNGLLTLGENIADNGGLKSSYHAFMHLDKEHKLLPGVPFSSEQLFFISFAQGWCSKKKKASRLIALQSDPHSPPEYRVIGSVSNSKEFAKAFNCPVGSPMNPAKKCEVW